MNRSLASTTKRTALRMPQPRRRLMRPASEAIPRTLASWRILRAPHSDKVLFLLETSAGEKISLRMDEANFLAALDLLQTYELEAFAHGERLA